VTWSPEEQQRRREEARMISRMLAARAGSLVGELRLRGERQGNEFVALNPTRHDRSLGSFRITLTGPKAGVWIDHATGEAGDALSLVAYCLYGGRLADAIAWAKPSLGLPTDGPIPEVRVREPPPAPADDGAAAAEQEKKREAAKGLWLAARPELRGTPVADYLARRGLDLARLRRQPRALRFHPRLWHFKARAWFPAMVAAITDDAGDHISTHCTFLAEDGGAWRKAPVEDPKLVFGSYRGGAIRIWRGASGKPLREAPEGDSVGLFEGIETALSVALACPELRVLCAVAINNMRNIALPPTIGTVFLGPDNDPIEDERDRVKRHNLLAATIAHFRAGDRDVRLAMPDVPGADWNDILQGVEG
jgi:hypothetical protein